MKHEYINKRRKNRYTSLILATSIMTAVLSGCSGNDEPANGTESRIETTGPVIHVETETESTQSETTEEITTSDIGSVPDGERDTDFSGCLFIGDSRTDGLMVYSGIDNATAYTIDGLMVDTYFTTAKYNMNGSMVTVSQAVEANHGFDRVYVMFGVNELGWPYDYYFKDKYSAVIDHLKETMPDAEINVQSIIPVTAERDARGDHINNENVYRFNSIISELCTEKGVNYIDLTEAICGDSAVLPTEASRDGVHLTKAYYEKWLDFLKSEMK